MDGETLQLCVDGTGGATISLRDRPPRLSTRELIRRFILATERHPRAPRPEKTSIAEIIVSFGFPVVFVTGAIAEAAMETSERQKDIGFYIILVIAFGLYLWHTVDDDDAARSDRTSKRAIARLRRGLRRMLNVPVP